jgi:hypothetical protein
MGWASGSELYDKVIDAARDAIPDPFVRTNFHKKMIEAFEDADWDTQNECVGQDVAFDAALYDLHPYWEDEVL